ncbi:hypothetical protein HHI36_023324 [Cryptolaemus montrouzieri]|uniref:DDE-1 domain-containing protein n=1 Tax=Cryptolaemus montrouzieri TaxID=559131 RepID=A0ABD2PGY7_9CUCU
MDAHASHINPEVILLAKTNDIFPFTFPALTSHILQPLDSLDDYMRDHPEKSNRTYFHEILNPPFISSFSHNNITNAFKRAGICPLNGSVIATEATTPSVLTAAPLAGPEATEARVAGIGPKYRPPPERKKIPGQHV